MASFRIKSKVLNMTCEALHSLYLLELTLLLTPLTNVPATVASFLFLKHIKQVSPLGSLTCHSLWTECLDGLLLYFIQVFLKCYLLKDFLDHLTKMESPISLPCYFSSILSTNNTDLFLYYLSPTLEYMLPERRDIVHCHLFSKLVSGTEQSRYSI